MIIAVSDIHLGSSVSNQRGFRQFIGKFLQQNQDDIEYLFLLGDIIDLWYRPNPEVLNECRGVLRELSMLDMKKVYLVGNHDFEVLSLGMMGSMDYPSTNVLNTVGLTRQLDYDGLELRFCHGHQIEYWSSLPFYESFCKAMCYFDPSSNDLSNLWSLVERFAEKEAKTVLEKIRNLPNDIRKEMQTTFAGPIDAHNGSQTPTIMMEWSLLQHVNSIDEVEARIESNLQNNLSDRVQRLRKSTGLGNSIEDARLGGFVQLWQEIAESISRHGSWNHVPQTVANTLNKCRRIAGSLTIDLKDNEYLVRGHGHSPYANDEDRIADSGSWLGERASYLMICDGKVEAKGWNP